MPQYDDRDRYGDHYGRETTRLYVGHLSSRTRSRDLDDLFGRYGRHGRSYSPSPRRGRSRSGSYSRGRSCSRSISPLRRERSIERVDRRRSRSPRYSRSPKPERKASPPPSRGRKRSSTPDELSPLRDSLSPREQRKTATGRNGSDYNSESPPRARGRSPSPGENSPAASRSRSGSRSPIRRDDRSPMKEERDMRGNHRGRGGIESPSA